MMTAYIVCQLARDDPKVLAEEITFSESADKTGGSTADVRTGEKVTVGELLYGLLLPSGNDAATAFAEHFGSRFDKASGGRESPGDENGKPAPFFIAEMNRRAAE